MITRRLPDRKAITRQIRRVIALLRHEQFAMTRRVFSNFRWKKRPLAENLEVKIIAFLFGINVFYNRTNLTLT